MTLIQERSKSLTIPHDINLYIYDITRAKTNDYFIIYYSAHYFLNNISENVEKCPSKFLKAKVMSSSPHCIYSHMTKKSRETQRNETGTKQCLAFLLEK